MPIPNPKSGEKQREFIQRCVIQISGEYGKKKALAICYDKYRNK
jgi:hypothetical protein